MPNSRRQLEQEFFLTFFLGQLYDQTSVESLYVLLKVRVIYIQKYVKTPFILHILKKNIKQVYFRSYLI